MFSSSAVVTITTALISAGSAIAVAWIGVLPAIRQGDQDTIRQLRAELEQAAPRPPGPTWTVKGLLSRLDGSQRSAVPNALVALMPVDGNKLVQYTDDLGPFAFPSVEGGQYYFIFSDNYSPGTRRGIVDVVRAASESKDFPGMIVGFSIDKD